MHRIYKTNFSNEVHQLIVSVSRHFYVTSKGQLKYQKKSFDVSLDKLDKLTKRHIVNYMIRDHFSGLSYVEIVEARNMFPVLEFLHRAWSKKDVCPLHGLPCAVTVPKNVRETWPELVPLLERRNVQSIKVTNGFQGGVREIRKWEERLRSSLRILEVVASGNPPTPEKAYHNAFRMLVHSDKVKVERWYRGLSGSVPCPPSKEVFSTRRSD